MKSLNMLWMDMKQNCSRWETEILTHPTRLIVKICWRRDDAWVNCIVWLNSRWSSMMDESIWSFWFILSSEFRLVLWWSEEFYFICVCVEDANEAAFSDNKMEVEYPWNVLNESQMTFLGANDVDENEKNSIEYHLECPSNCSSLFQLRVLSRWSSSNEHDQLALKYSPLPPSMWSYHFDSRWWHHSSTNLV